MDLHWVGGVNEMLWCSLIPSLEVPAATCQWQIQGGPKDPPPPPPPLFLDQTKKICFRPVPLTVTLISGSGWPGPPPLSEGLDLPLNVYSFFSWLVQLILMDILHVGIIWGHSRPSFNRLHCSHNLIPFSNLCKAALRSLFCALKDATNYWSAFQVSLHSNWQINNGFLTGLSWHTLKSWAQMFEGHLGLIQV